MGKIVISQNVTLDGVVQDPTGDEGVPGGGWFLKVTDADRDAWAASQLDEARGAAALLLGRRSDEWFAARWPSRSGEWADRLNGLPKYVVSSTRRAPAWGNATVVEGDVVRAVSRLRDEVDGDILVYASTRLVHALVEHGLVEQGLVEQGLVEQGLVDELRLTVFPVVVGAGERLFGASGGAKALRLVDTRTVGESLVHLVYRPVRGG